MKNMIVIFFTLIMVVGFLCDSSLVFASGVSSGSSSVEVYGEINTPVENKTQFKPMYIPKKVSIDRKNSSNGTLPRLGTSKTDLFLLGFMIFVFLVVLKNLERDK